MSASRLAAAAGAGLALATLGGYLMSVWIGLFGFKEVHTGAGLAAGLVEVAGFVVLAALALAPAQCYGSCAVYWPPVTGTAAASLGVPGQVGMITRTGGSQQLTYSGHPRYIYIGDSAPGQARATTSTAASGTR